MSSEQDFRVAVLGGGAAGFFAAIRCKEIHPNADVVLVEATGKLLSKVKVSGGGRCNVTTAAPDHHSLLQGYPRGSRPLKGLFHRFDNHDAMDWFESRGVSLYAQEDGRVFPTTDDSQTIVDLLIDEARTCGVRIESGTRVNSLEKSGSNDWTLHTRASPLIANKVIICTGGSPKRSGLEWLETLGHEIVDPVPSLFTFNMPGNEITELTGLSVPIATVNLVGTKLNTTGPLLITHWGMSGPAILKMSALAARELADAEYTFQIRIRWCGDQTEEQLRNVIREAINSSGGKHLHNYTPFDIPKRLWSFLLGKCEFRSDHQWSDLGKKGINKLVDKLMNDTYNVEGKTTFKEEFVTCGGVSLHSVNMKTMESKVAPGIYFAGEVLDIDGITGGYNFQAAWTTAYVAGELAS